MPVNQSLHKCNFIVERINIYYIKDKNISRNYNIKKDKLYNPKFLRVNSVVKFHKILLSKGINIYTLKIKK